MIEPQITRNLFDELETIINEFNTRFGINNWTDDDKVKNFLFQQLPADLAKDHATVNAVQNSDKQNAKITSDKKVEDLMQDVIFTYTDLYKKFTDDADFKRPSRGFSLGQRPWARQSTSRL